ncbi:MAG: pyridoxamine 5'-phosphate oxidase family protein [Chloroflexi bacterium]|nr:pyridoxamine 5'-phosphate oxidase family protein [Chloroflexota bacterium]
MNPEVLDKAVQLAGQVGYTLIATANARGQPHVAAAGRISLTPEKHLAVSEWFCPGTLANLQANSRVAIIIWDIKTDTGYQILGEMEEVKDMAVLDGYVPAERKSAIPQVERQLLLHVDKIIDFKRAPHNDVQL